MSEYPEASFLKEFVRRTKVNLEIVEQVANDDPQSAYEVTQLTNSLFGLLILPQQKYYDLLTNVPNSDVPKFRKYKSLIQYQNKNTLNYAKAIERLRNALGHPKAIEFESQDGQIERLKLVDNFNPTDRFSIILEVKQLKEIVFELCDVLIEKIGAVED